MDESTVEDERPIGIGTVVWLRSGGAPMVVTAKRAGEAECTRDGKREWYPEATLTTHRPDVATFREHKWDEATEKQEMAAG